MPKVHQPLPSNHHPELDISATLNDEETNLYESYISWIVELGHLDFYVHITFMSSYN
jgi:hypothetical protein